MKLKARCLKAKWRDGKKSQPIKYMNNIFDEKNINNTCFVIICEFKGHNIFCCNFSAATNFLRQINSKNASKGGHRGPSDD